MRKILVSSFVVVLFVGLSASAQKRNITEKDLFDFNWVGDPQVSPDGSTVAFVKVTVNEKRDGYNTSIWSVSTSGNDEPHRLMSGIRDGSPRWSPDGKYLTFVRVTEKDGRPDHPQLFMLSMAGGDSFQYTSLPRGAGGPIWSPDGKWIAFGSGTNPDDQVKKSQPDGHDSDVRVITRAVYRSNGAGYLEFSHPQHLWVIAAPRTPEDTPTPKQITTGTFSEGEFIWSRDGSKIYFTSRHIVEQYYELPQTELYSVPAAGGTPTQITTIDMGAGNITLSPDGRSLAFVASIAKPVQSYTEPDLWVMDVAPGAKPRNLTGAFDYDLGSRMRGGKSPPRSPGGSAIVWTPDG